MELWETVQFWSLMSVVFIVPVGSLMAVRLVVVSVFGSPFPNFRSTFALGFTMNNPSVEDLLVARDQCVSALLKVHLT